MALDMTTTRWDYMTEYSREVFGSQDVHLAGLMDEAVRAGLPDIAVSSNVGRLLKILTSLTRAALAIEVGTLGGYSGIWQQPGEPLTSPHLEQVVAPSWQQIAVPLN